MLQGLSALSRHAIVQHLFALPICKVSIFIVFRIWQRSGSKGSLWRFVGLDIKFQSFRTHLGTYFTSSINSSVVKGSTYKQQWISLSLGKSNTKYTDRHIRCLCMHASCVCSYTHTYVCMYMEIRGQFWLSFLSVIYLLLFFLFIYTFSQCNIF